MKNILYPTDFSENSLQALPYALDVALLLGANLTLFNAYSLPYSKSNLLVSMTERMKKDAENDLKKLADDALAKERYRNMTINCIARSGALVSQIPLVVKDLKIDMVVMGTKGASGLKEIFIGSNTLEVIHLTHCPVLAIPEEAQNTKVNKIAMATDLKKVSENDQLKPLFEMAKICRASIEFVHIIRPKEKANSEERAAQLLVLEEMAGEIQTSVHMATNDDIIDGLSNYIDELKPDMLGMLSRKHSLFERLFQKSITNKLSFRTKIPLLVLDE